MSTQQLDQQQVVAASGNILRGVYAPVYFQKLAERGHAPRNEKEAEELLELGFKLAETAAQVGSQQSKYASAVSALDQLRNGQAGQGDYQLKAAAVQLAGDPAIYASAMVLQAAENAA